MDKLDHWQVSTISLTQRVSHLLESKPLADCKFSVGTAPNQQIIEGHKLLLAISSPVFEAMFYGILAEKMDIISVNDIEPKTFKTFLEYIYTDKVIFSSYESACEVYYCAQKYILPHLTKICIDHLSSVLSSDNACKIYEFAKLFEEFALIEKCLEIICDNTSEIFEGPSWEAVELSTIVTIFERKILNVKSEVELFAALERWAKKNCHNDSSKQLDAKSIRSEIEDLLFLIRFLALTPQQFADGPGVSDLITQDEKFAIFMNLCSSQCDVPMPDKFSGSRLNRKELRTILRNYKVYSSDDELQCDFKMIMNNH